MSNLAEASTGTSAFQNITTFEDAQRMAMALVESKIVPENYRGKKNLPDAIIALEMSQRIGASPLAVMQNLYLVHGKPSWSSQFLIACVNTCGRFLPLEFVYEGEGDDWGCYARTCRISDGTELRGPRVNIAMAKAEGWYNRNGSKWKTLPELMLSYRAGTYFSRLHCPEIGLGMRPAEELIDIYGEDNRPENRGMSAAQRIKSKLETEKTSTSEGDSNE